MTWYGVIGCLSGAFLSALCGAEMWQVIVAGSFFGIFEEIEVWSAKK